MLNVENAVYLPDHVFLTLTGPARRTTSVSFSSLAKARSEGMLAYGVPCSTIPKPVVIVRFSQRLLKSASHGTTTSLKVNHTEGCSAHVCQILGWGCTAICSDWMATCIMVQTPCFKPALLGPLFVARSSRPSDRRIIPFTLSKLPPSNQVDGFDAFFSDHC